MPVFYTILLALLVFATGCIGDIQSKAGVGNFGGTPTQTATGTTGSEYADCMNVCTQYSGQTGAQCTQACCISDCSENSPGGADACINQCLGGTLPASPHSTSTLLPGVTPGSSATSGFTCDYDENLIRTSSDFRIWFNTSCHYNSFCGWFESDDLQKPTPTPDCVNCSSYSFSQQATPAQTPCPVRTTRTGTTAPTGVTTSATLSSGTCGSGLTECRVFSTNYCVDLMTDIKHCGACRKGCLLVHAENGCSSGTCYIKKCDFGWADCNGVASDGCEVDLNADDNNCGKCGRVCSLPNAGHAVCNGVDENGKCEVEHCMTGWINTNGIHEDGCESTS